MSHSISRPRLHLLHHHSLLQEAPHPPHLSLLSSHTLAGVGGRGEGRNEAAGLSIGPPSPFPTVPVSLPQTLGHLAVSFPLVSQVILVLQEKLEVFS